MSMKKLKLVLLGVLALFVIFAGCQKEEVNEEDLLPLNFKVEVPDCISHNVGQKSMKGDAVEGDEIYGHLRTFISVGESAADIVEDIIQAIRKYGLNKPMEFSYESDDDGRTKNVVIIVNWDFQLTTTDAVSEGNDDGGIGLQVFWNKSPVKGIAILHPYNLNRTEVDDWAQAMFRIDYSEAGEFNYEQHMIVYISDMELGDPATEPYAMQTMKMFVGKTGDIVEVYGNSNHPNAVFHSGNYVGFNWAFVAAGNEVTDIGVAEVGLPASTITASTREVILIENSIRNIFTREIEIVYPNATQEQLDAYLLNTNPPGFFNSDGFVTAGSSPNASYEPLTEAILNLTPYVPNDVSNLKIEFKTSSTTE